MIFFLGYVVIFFLSWYDSPSSHHFFCLHHYSSRIATLMKHSASFILLTFLYIRVNQEFFFPIAPSDARSDRTSIVKSSEITFSVTSHRRNATKFSMANCLPLGFWIGFPRGEKVTQGQFIVDDPLLKSRLLRRPTYSNSDYIHLLERLRRWAIILTPFRRGGKCSLVLISSWTKLRYLPQIPAKAR